MTTLVWRGAILCIAFGVALGCGRAAGKADASSDGGAANEVAAPDSGTPGALPWRNGDRLRARVLDGGDDARWFLGWQDQQLGLACSFKVGTDGALYCLPDAPTTGFVYGDASCQERLVYADAAATTLYMLVPTAMNPGCIWSRDAPTEVVSVDLQQSYSSFWFLSDNGECTKVETPPGSPADYHPAKSVALSTFVSAKVTELAGADVLSARRFDASDGAQQVVGFASRDSGQACFAEDAYSPDHSARCFPEQTLILPPGSAIAEGMCDLSAPVSANCPAPTALIAATATDCGASTYSLAAVSLSPSSPSSGASEFCRGTALSAATFPPVAMLEQGTGRLRARPWATSDSIAVTALAAPVRAPTAPRFTDSSDGHDCVWFTKSTGEHLCLSSDTDPGLGNFFADAACKTPLHLHGQFCPPHAAPARVTWPARLTLGDRAPPVEHVYQLGERFTGQAYVNSEKTPGACVPYSLDFEFYQLGTEEDLAGLPTLSERTE